MPIYKRMYLIVMNFLDFLIKNSKKYNAKTINYKLRKIVRKVNNKLFPLFTQNKIRLLENNFNEILSTSFPQKSKIPLNASIEINNTCNLKCLMCNTHLSKRPFGYMELDLFELILKELIKIGINSVGLHTVGEPLMYKDLDGLFNLIDKYNFKISLSTNGQFPHRLKNLLRSYSHLLNDIRFSIDGATPKVYENIRRGAEFKKLIQSLEIFHKFNHEKINYNLDVKIGSVINMTNIYEIPTFFKTYGKYCWPENIRFTLINSLSPDSSYFWETLPFPNLVRKTVPCIMPFKSIIFTYDGKITLCCRDYNGDLVVGDIRNNSIIEIWNGKLSEKIRNQHLISKDLEIELCQECYSPIPFISLITDDFIHSLYYKNPRLSEFEFGERILKLLKDIDNGLKIKDFAFLSKKHL